MSNKLVQGQIDRQLDAGMRFVFGPKQKYAGPGIMENPLEWKPENLTLLSNTVSGQMIKKYQESIADALKENNDYIVYVDCSKKWKKELMAYILECFIGIFVKKEDQEALVKDMMVRPSPLNNDGRTKWKDWVDNYTWDNFVNDLFTEYTTQFEEFCTEREAAKPWMAEVYKLKAQGYMFFHMAQLMDKYGERENNLYIDHPEDTTEFEQKGVNAFLQTRWQIGATIDKFFNLKINNASKARKMYPTHSWHNILEGHDYYTRNIDEDELITGKTTYK